MVKQINEAIEELESINRDIRVIDSYIKDLSASKEDNVVVNVLGLTFPESHVNPNRINIYAGRNGVIELFKENMKGLMNRKAVLEEIFSETETMLIQAYGRGKRESE